MNQKFFTKNVTTIATCIWIKLKNHKILGFTNHSYNLTINDIAYYSIPNSNISAIAKTQGLEADNLNISTIVDHHFIKPQEINSGLYDQAEIEIFTVDYLNPNEHKISLQKGYIGEIKLIGDQFFAEINSLEASTDQTIIGVYSPTCRVKFCGKSCGIEESKYTFSSEITSVITQSKLTIKPLDLPRNYFNYGQIYFEDGDYSQQKFNIKSHNYKIITLNYSLPFKPQLGQEIKLIAGCDKTFNSCCDKFYNAINFRGEPHLPGLDQLFKPGGI
ncbi:DUF2163 domain-containing protein [Rickettsiales endosymbiont of Stachyamoeba lipophora]|uniref:DUF2163 domain-containing protein n=1 Tax=Rickettsiales endosymbiont of Stachyamoeba lipophora TaxID=2486578 RepID=UPI000F65536A|nr:DUF2163 domain-containing protein [Rickettsiales endosymbiont of Stachyamoeba lipophora]AZL15539.1 DUF2163 domain-containing protein [Rickettsiales endosymbiont of Stachyamoeba lipophora]